MIKLSGELLSQSKNSSFDEDGLKSVCELIQGIAHEGAQVAIVIGAGNIIRGKELETGLKLDRTESDLIGMYATIVNSLTLKASLHRFQSLDAVVMAPAHLIGLRGGVKESSILSYDAQLARSMLESNTIVICAGGTGNPFFTTDSAAVLRAVELKAALVVKSTKVNGIFSKDPILHQDAQRYTSLSYEEAIRKNLTIMDQTAFVLAKEHNIPLFIYKHGSPPSLVDALRCKDSGTFVTP